MSPVDDVMVTADDAVCALAPCASEALKVNAHDSKIKWKSEQSKTFDCCDASSYVAS